MEINIVIGGAAGQGLETIAFLLSKSLARQSYGVRNSRDYMSRVRGGHNFSRLRIATESPLAASENIDILVALNEETYQLHRRSLEENGRVVFDPDSFSLPEDISYGVPVPLVSLAREAGGAIMSNTVATGAVLVLLGMDTSVVETLLEEEFAAKKGMAEKNIAALQAGHQAAAQTCQACFQLPDPKRGENLIFLEGNEALGMSALASGCRFLSAYPMTPATGIMSYLAGKQQEYDLVVEQAEDEIAAINMALGASYTGVRSMTSTSGGGFALMAEGLSLAGMTETPLVVVLAMRPGPATGLPTRTEQGDLDFALFAGHGEFPRAILSATCLEDAFYRLNKAFDLAEKYQVPVIFLSDQDFADTARSIPQYDFSRLTYNRYLLETWDTTTPYRRYQLTESGVSPRALPGQFPGQVVLADSDEHDEDGHIIEDASMRKIMVEKRLARLEALASEMDEPEQYGARDPDLLLVGWGSTYGALREAVDILTLKGNNIAMLHFSDLWPLPTKTLTALAPRVHKSFCVENNATGQLAGLIRRQTGLELDHQILKYDGRPFLPADIVREVKIHG